MRRNLFLSGIAVLVLLSSGLVVSVKASSEWTQTYGDLSRDSAYAVVETSDGGYILPCYTDYPGGTFWLVKTDGSGNMEWNKTYGIGASELVQTSDGGYAIAGHTGMVDVLLVKTDGFGNMEWNQTYGGANWEEVHSLVVASDGGYAIAGYTESFGAGDKDFWLVKTDAYGNMEWNQTYGEEGYDSAYSLAATSDGGYAVAGWTNSFGAGSNDFWLVKTDAYGNMEWNQTYGGPGNDRASSLVVTSDGGYAIVGTQLIKIDENGSMEWNQSYSGSSLVATSDGGYAIAGGQLLVKLDAYGNMEWNQTYGGADWEIAYSVVETSDGGYAIAGAVTNLTTAGFVNYDAWLSKIDEYGNTEWVQTYGWSNNDLAYAAVETSDGGYVITGETSVVSGSREGWLFKTGELADSRWGDKPGGFGYALVEPSDGGIAAAGYKYSSGTGSYDFWFWKRPDTAWVPPLSGTYGGTGDDRAYSLVETSDGGYALAGYTESFGAGLADFWLIKIDSWRTMEWNQTYGGPEDDIAYSVVETSDGGYALAGTTSSFGSGGTDFWLVKTDDTGNTEWTQTYGGPGDEVATSLVATSDGGYALAGATESFGAGGADFWLVKTDTYGNMEWNQTYGGEDSDCAHSLVGTSDGGYAIAGETKSYGAGEEDFWLVKTDASGNIEWSQTYGGEGNEVAHSLVTTSDGGYALAGYTNSFGSGSYDFWLVKTNEMGIIPEYSSWLLPSLLLTATFVIVVYKKKPFKRSS